MCGCSLLGFIVVVVAMNAFGLRDSGALESCDDEQDVSVHLVNIEHERELHPRTLVL